MSLRVSELQSLHLSLVLEDLQCFEWKSICDSNELKNVAARLQFRTLLYSRIINSAGPQSERMISQGHKTKVGNFVFYTVRGAHTRLQRDFAPEVFQHDTFWQARASLHQVMSFSTFWLNCSCAEFFMLRVSEGVLKRERKSVWNFEFEKKKIRRRRWKQLFSKFFQRMRTEKQAQ